ncbi:MAG: ATP-binding protein [Spirochaetia bacterium]|jgi:signal transduction histidine kinase
MDNVALIAAVAACTLLASQALLLLVRAGSSARRASPLLLAIFLLFLSLLLVISPAETMRSLLVVPAVWAAGAFLMRAQGSGKSGAWACACVGVFAVLVLATALGFQGSAPFTALQAFGILLLACFPIATLFRLWRAARSAAALSTLACSCLWVLAGAGRISIQLLRMSYQGRFDVWPILLISLCTSWLIFQDGYPSHSGWRGSLPGQEGAEGFSRSLHARLLASENALAGQSRMIASGFLAMAAAHEFKNVLSAVKATAQHGLAATELREKDASLSLVLEHAEIARDSAVGTLDRLSLEGREAPRRIVADQDLARAISRLRTGFRGQGIMIESDLAAGTAFRARPGDVDQVLLNLVRNAAEAYRTRGSEEKRVVRISAGREADSAVIEVRDMAGGVPDDQEHRLFTPSFSGSGSTGLGLYLSRNLASANGGSLEYQPLDGGSVFRLVFPAEEGE